MFVFRGFLEPVLAIAVCSQAVSRYKCLFTLNLLAECLRRQELTRYKNIFVYLRELNAAVCYEAAALRSGL